MVATTWMLGAAALIAGGLALSLLERRNTAFHASPPRAGDAASQPGVSLRARLMIGLIGLLNVRRAWSSEVQIREAIRRDRRAGPCLPPEAFARRFAVDMVFQDDRPIYRVRPRTQVALGHVFYLHGGGFVLSMTSLHWEFIGKLVQRLGYEVIVPFYPLAPESRIDATLDFVRRAYQAERKRLPGRWTVMGDSAGGALALAMAMQLRDCDAGQPAQLLLLSPVLDFSGDSAADPDGDPIVDRRALPILAKLCAPNLPATDPRVSPICGRLEGLPRTTVFVGGRDVAQHSVRRFMRAASLLQAPMSLIEYPGMVHVWPLFPVPEADRAFSQIAQALGAGCVRAGGERGEIGCPH